MPLRFLNKTQGSQIVCFERWRLIWHQPTLNRTSYRLYVEWNRSRLYRAESPCGWMPFLLSLFLWGHSNSQDFVQNLNSCLNFGNTASVDKVGTRPVWAINRMKDILYFINNDICKRCFTVVLSGIDLHNYWSRRWKTLIFGNFICVERLGLFGF